MTVASSSNKVTYQGNGATTGFSFTFSNDGDEDDILVFITDSDGDITQLATNLYEVTLTAPSGTNPTGIGGSVEYPLSGSPLASGNFITILRQLPFTQQTSLANQGTLWQPTIEASLDVISMQVAQLNERLGRQFTVPVSDDDPEEVPSATQRASQNAIWDSAGNLAAGLPAAGSVNISSAMQPVVEAATLALARDELELGDMATKAIGTGLEDDGAGAVRVINLPVAVSGAQAVDATFHQKEYHATGALTFTNPVSTSLFDGFGYTVYALTAAITFAINAADRFAGGALGVSGIIPAGTRAWVSTDGAGNWFLDLTVLPAYGSFVNCKIVASVAANNLTVELKDRNGNDPSTNSPALFAFRDPTNTNGNPVYRAVTGALSIVAGAGASLGFVNAECGRAWLVAFDNGGSPVLGLVNCLSGQSIFALAQYPLGDSTQISAAATAAHVIYTQGTGLTDKAFLILGYLSWEPSNELATAGNWSAAPSRIQLFGPGVPVPGQTVQSLRTPFTALVTGASTITVDNSIPPISEGVQYMTRAITPTSGANLIHHKSLGNISNSGVNSYVTAALFQDAFVDALGVGAVFFTTINTMLQIVTDVIKKAGTVSAMAMQIRMGPDAGQTVYLNGVSGVLRYNGTMNSYMEATEIMA